MHSLGFLRRPRQDVHLCSVSDSEGSESSRNGDRAPGEGRSLGAAAGEELPWDKGDAGSSSGSSSDLEAAEAQSRLQQQGARTKVWGVLPLGAYNTFLRVRTAYAVATACVALVSMALGVSLQVFFSVFSVQGEGNGLKGFWVIFLAPVFFLAAATLADEMLDLCLDALDNPPLANCRALFIVTGVRPGCIDHFLLTLSELLPIVFTVWVTSGDESPQLSKASAAYIEGSQLCVIALAIAQLAAHARVIFVDRADEAQEVSHALDVREVLVGQTEIYMSMEWRHLEVHEKGGRSNKLVRGQTEIKGVRRMRMQPRTAAVVFAASLGVLLLLAFLAQSGYISFVVALAGMAGSLILMSRATSYMLPGLVGMAFNVLIGLFIVIAVGLLLFSRSGVLDVDLRTASVPNVFEPPPGGRANYTAAPHTNGVYPICLMHWGRQDLPDKLRLSVLDLAVFADAVYYSYMPEVMQVVRNATLGTDIEAVELVELADRSIVGRWGVFYLKEAKVRILAIRGTTSRQDTMADADMYAAIQVMQTFNQFLPVLSLYPTSFTRRLLGYFAIHRWLGERAMWRDVAVEAMKLKRKCAADGSELIVTGHSLGGSLASIAGALVGVPAVAFSPPGQRYSSERFGIPDQKELEKSGTVVMPRHDIVPQVDLQVGFTQIIECDATPLNCHAIGRTACELFKSCGDPRGRSMKENCAMYSM